LSALKKFNTKNNHPMKITDANLLILTSTYPRWSHDTTPGFVADFAHGVAPSFKAVHVLAPHFPAAARHEATGNLDITRYRYFWPASAETIAYNGGAVSKIKKTPLYALQLLCFMTSLFAHTLFITLTKRVTIINAHWLIPQGFVGVLVKFLTGRKLVITIHGSDVLSLNGNIMRAIKRFTLRHADVVCVNSSVTKAACIALYPRHYSLIPMGIDVERFAGAVASTKLKKQYNLHDFTILFVGRLSEEKGIIYLLEALGSLQAAGKSFTAIIVGSGPLEAKLQQYIADNDLAKSVIMTGWIDNSELPTYYKTADVMVGPSLHEAQGLVFLEALAAGLPVITTTAGGTKDFVKNEVNGFLVEPRSPHQIVDVLTTLYDDRALLQKLAQAAPGSVREKYSWHAVTMRYTHVFKELL
jgi:glycosyltransferase involved in cell wall biosynthesis